MIKAWNRVVRPEDRVIVVGDFYWSRGGKDNFEALMQELNGVKGLIIGNHDGYGRSYYMQHFAYVADRMDWNRFIFTHRPLKGRIPKGRVNIHGHTHQYSQRCGREIKVITKQWDCDRVCVSVETVNYEPVVIWKGNPDVRPPVGNTTG